MLHLKTLENTSSKVADTGSAVHAAIHAWHETGDVEKAIKSMRSRYAEFPQADFEDAILSLRPYCKDPRNAPEEVTQSEIKVELVLPSPDGLDIVVHGRIDQVRRKDNRVWDIKHSDRAGFELTHDYGYQLAAYARALRLQVGGIILPKAYRKRGVKDESPPGIFWPTLWTDDHIDKLLDEVVRTVLSIRQGQVPIRPGPHCAYCPAGSFLDCAKL